MDGKFGPGAGGRCQGSVRGYCRTRGRCSCGEARDGARVGTFSEQELVKRSSDFVVGDQCELFAIRSGLKNSCVTAPMLMYQDSRSGPRGDGVYATVE